ncbi:sulfotransferase family 2 domain-containing protein [Patiriisocius sp. Uisw_017]|jgi:hypothetical protein|uniref:sulfotransferase family 2 domain-containing protein n=1 Tax=Patiriisocius sp. Uisw_017 TaxID=3230968 RepID=UPI0039EA9752
MISHKHKCIFIHIPKTAGTSINSFFFPEVTFHFKNPDYERLFGYCPKRKLHMQHATSKQLIETGLVTEKQWGSYFKFTFVRNPWDRAYSDYKWVKGFSGVDGNFKSFINATGNFKKILRDNSENTYLGDHLLSQSSFFDKEGLYVPDFIGRFENFSDDIKTIITKLKIEKEFDVFKNKGLRKKDYSRFYTNSRKNLIDIKYCEDIVRFDYSFVDMRTGVNLIKKFL